MSSQTPHGPSVRKRFPGHTASVAAARRFVAEVMGPELVGSEIADAALLAVSELSTNAIVHARSAIDIVVQIDRHCLRVEVHDASAGPVVRKHYGAQAATGRGLGMVETVVDRWSVLDSTEGKVVWFEIDQARRGTRFPNSREAALAPDASAHPIDDPAPAGTGRSVDTSESRVA